MYGVEFAAAPRRRRVGGRRPPPPSALAVAAAVGLAVAAAVGLARAAAAVPPPECLRVTSAPAAAVGLAVAAALGLAVAAAVGVTVAAAVGLAVAAAAVGVTVAAAAAVGVVAAAAAAVAAAAGGPGAVRRFGQSRRGHCLPPRGPRVGPGSACQVFSRRDARRYAHTARTARDAVRVALTPCEWGPDSVRREVRHEFRYGCPPAPPAAPTVDIKVSNDYYDAPYFTFDPPLMPLARGTRTDYR